MTQPSSTRALPDRRPRARQAGVGIVAVDPRRSDSFVKLQRCPPQAALSSEITGSDNRFQAPVASRPCVYFPSVLLTLQLHRCVPELRVAT
jgi:hypothetical protein